MKCSRTARGVHDAPPQAVDAPGFVCRMRAGLFVGRCGAAATRSQPDTVEPVGEAPGALRFQRRPVTGVVLAQLGH